MSNKKLKVPRDIKNLLRQIHAQVEAVWPDFTFTLRALPGTAKQPVTVADSFFRNKSIRDRYTHLLTAAVDVVDEHAQTAVLLAAADTCPEDICTIFFRDGKVVFLGSDDPKQAAGCIFLMAKTVIPELSLLKLPPEVADAAAIYLDPDSVQSRVAVVMEHLTAHIEKYWPDFTLLTLKDNKTLICKDAATRKAAEQNLARNAPPKNIEADTILLAIDAQKIDVKLTASQDVESASYRIRHEYTTCTPVVDDYREIPPVVYGTAQAALTQLGEVAARHWPGHRLMVLPVPAERQHDLASRYHLFRNAACYHRWRAHAKDAVDNFPLPMSAFTIVIAHDGRVQIDAATCPTASCRDLVKEMLRGPTASPAQALD